MGSRPSDLEADRRGEHIAECSAEVGRALTTVVADARVRGEHPADLVEGAEVAVDNHAADRGRGVDPAAEDIVSPHSEVEVGEHLPLVPSGELREAAEVADGRPALGSLAVVLVDGAVADDIGTIADFGADLTAHDAIEVFERGAGKDFESGVIKERVHKNLRW